MKKLITMIVCAVALVTTAVCADTNSLFNAREFGVALSSGYVLDTAAPFKQAYGLNANASVSWFQYRNFGVEATVPFYSTKGVSASEVEVGVLARLPLAKTVPVFRNIAPYVGIGGVYNWETDSKWAYIAKAGVEFRLNSKWGVFVEDQFRNDTLKTYDHGQNTLVSGVKLVF